MLGHTLLKTLHPGMPRSRANDQIMRDDDAMAPTVAVTIMAVTMAAMTVLPPRECVAW